MASVCDLLWFIYLKMQTYTSFERGKSKRIHMTVAKSAGSKQTNNEKKNAHDKKIKKNQCLLMDTEKSKLVVHVQKVDCVHIL